MFYIDGKEKKYTPLFDGTHITCYIKFKLLHKFRIVEFFFSFQNVNIMPILLEIEF